MSSVKRGAGPFADASTTPCCRINDNASSAVVMNRSIYRMNARPRYIDRELPLDGGDTKMRWQDNRESDNVEDRRDDSGGGGGMRFGGIHLGVGGVVIVLLGSWLFGVNPLTVLGLLSGDGAATAPTQSTPAHQPPANDTLAGFVSTILASTEDVWGAIFAQSGGSYQRPRLVLFR